MLLRHMLSVMLVAGLLMGCQAFNDHNEEGKFLGSIGLTPPEGSENVGEGDVLCSANANVAVKQNSSAAVTESMLGDAVATTTVSQLNETTLYVTVSNAQSTVSFGLIDDQGTLSACNVSVKQGETEQQVNSGTILVGALNQKGANATMNAGTFVFTVQEAPAATKAVKTLIGGKADEVKEKQIDGSYFAESVAKP